MKLRAIQKLGAGAEVLQITRMLLEHFGDTDSQGRVEEDRRTRNFTSILQRQNIRDQFLRPFDCKNGDQQHALVCQRFCDL